MNDRLIDFAELRRRVAFEPVLAHYGLKLAGKGAQRSVLCPFHSETNPSCKVNLSKKIFRCFGCDAKGNILDFIQRMEDASLTAAAEKLAEICKVDLPLRNKDRLEGAARRRGGPRTPQDTRKRRSTEESARSTEKPQAEAPDEPEEVKNPPLTFTLKLDPTHPYFAERALSKEIIEAFGLGYCNRGMMKGRICIPIHNEQGELVAYAGRWPSDQGYPEGEDKYKLPPNFRKSQLLFNLNRVPSVDQVILVEGYFAVFRLVSLGYENVVALMGSSLSDDQEDLLAARFTKVVVLLDGDLPGRTAAAALVPHLARRLFVRDAVMPDGTEPDSVAEELLRGLLEPFAVR